MHSRFKSNRSIVILSAGSIAWLFATATLVGCDKKSLPPRVVDPIAVASESESTDDIRFHYLVESNREDDGTVAGLSFIDTDGETVSVDQYKGKQNVLLVFTRGFSGSLCPFCTTQTSRLIANYDEFKSRDTEVLLVYPGSKDQIEEFMQAGMEGSGKDAFPFPVLLDEELAAVNRLGIAAHLAFPSTFLIDKLGNVRLSYVGSTPSDRPSIRALLEQIDAI